MRGGERGSGLLGSVLGVACTAALLGLAVNLLVGLWVRSTVDAVAHDAARDIATTPEGVDRVARATDILDSAEASLGRYGDGVELTLEVADTDRVVVHVTAPGVDLLPAMLDGGPTVGPVDRRIVVRSESP